jgi:hypothetical protein
LGEQPLAQARLVRSTLGDRFLVTENFLQMNFLIEISPLARFDDSDGRMLLQLMEIVGGDELPKPAKGNLRVSGTSFS